MTRREVERVAAAVKRIADSPEEQNPARVSILVGRAVLGAGASEEAWRKWLVATGWPKEIASNMARLEAEK